MKPQINTDSHRSLCEGVKRPKQSPSLIVSKTGDCHADARNDIIVNSSLSKIILCINGGE
jgi:hypothetical protein